MKKLEFFLKNIFLKVLLLFYPVREINTNMDEEFSKVLFIRLNRIGDALVTTPLLHEIKQRVKCKTYVLADKKNYFVFDKNPDVDFVKIFNKGIKGIFEVLKYIKDEDIQTVVDLHDDVSTTVSFLIAMSGAKNKFGLEKENKTIYTKTVKRLDSTKIHIIDRMMNLANFFNIEPGRIDNAKVYFYPSEKAKNIVDKFIKGNLNTTKIIIGINISAGSKARFWGVDKFRQLLKDLGKLDVNLLLLSAPDDFNLAKEISVGKTKIFYSESFDEFAAMIAKLGLLITPDTAAVHIASANNIPVFGIYVKYNTKDMIWSAYNTQFDCVITEEPTLENISYEEVGKKLDQFIRQINFIT